MSLCGLNRMALFFLTLLVTTGLSVSEDPRSVEKVLLPIRHNGRYGFIDGQGKTVIPPRFYWAFQFEEGRALVYVCGKYGFVNEKGTLVVPAKFDATGWFFSAGLARVRVDRKWGFVDRDGTLIIAPQFDNATDFSEDGLAAVEMSGKWGYVNKSGAFVIRAKYSSAGTFSEGLAPVQFANSGKWGYVDRTGLIRVAPRYDGAATFSEGRAAVTIANKWGYIDKKGVITIPFRYPYAAGAFSEGLALVLTTNWKYGFVDKNGKVVIAPRFEAAQGFYSGVAPAVLENKVGYLDHKGNWVFPPVEGGLDYAWNGFIAVSPRSADGKEELEWGYLGPNGKFLWRGPVTEEPTHEMWPISGFTEEEKQHEIAKSCDQSVP